jgi:hypothetical protein
MSSSDLLFKQQQTKQKFCQQLFVIKISHTETASLKYRVFLSVTVSAWLSLFHNTPLERYYVKGAWHEIFDFRILLESVSPWPLSILLGPFRMAKIRGDIHSFMMTPAIICPTVLTTLAINNQGCRCHRGDKLFWVSLAPGIKPCSRFSSIPLHRRLIYRL